MQPKDHGDENIPGTERSGAFMSDRFQVQDRKLDVSQPKNNLRAQYAHLEELKSPELSSPNMRSCDEIDQLDQIEDEILSHEAEIQFKGDTQEPVTDDEEEYRSVHAILKSQ
jgi:hypothetical protein